MILTRYVKNDFITLGSLASENGIFATVERPWLDNQRNVSCIPDGTYTVKRINSPKFGKRCWEVTKVPDRSHILFHVANYPHNVEGCIGLGKGVMSDFKGVSSSRNAVDAFYAATEDLEEFELTVVTAT